MTDNEFLPFPARWSGEAALHRYLVCDVFAEEPLAGNQLAVYLDGRPFSPDDMQPMARELGIAETVFVLPPSSGG